MKRHRFSFYIWCVVFGLLSLLLGMSACSSGDDDDDAAAGNGAAATGEATDGVTAGTGGTGAAPPTSGAGGTEPEGGSSGTEPESGAGGTEPEGGAGSTEPEGGSGGTEPEDGSDGTEPESGTDGGAAGAAGTDAGAAGEAGGTGDPDYDACMASLEDCTYESLETNCRSFSTFPIPLTDGSTHGPVVFESGPYGAYVEWNEGEDFANPVNPAEVSCDLVAGFFFEPPGPTAEILDLRDADLGLYTVFRPACPKEGEKYPVITWGNGTCGQSGGYSFLAILASHGFYVFSTNSRFTGSGAEILRALDFAEAANEDPDSIYYQKLDLDKIGLSGHSQGASGAQAASSDPRIRSVMLWNGGSPAGVDKPVMAVSGERDMGNPTVESLSSSVMGLSQPAAWLYYHQVLVTGGAFTGHLTNIEQPERVWEPTLAWFKYTLSGDDWARDMLLGDDCGLCTRPDEFEYGHNSQLN